MIVTFRDKSSAAAARAALNGASILRSDALKVRFATSLADGDDGGDENDLDESDLALPDDPESDGMDYDDFDDF